MVVIAVPPFEMLLLLYVLVVGVPVGAWALGSVFH